MQHPHLSARSTCNCNGLGSCLAPATRRRSVTLDVLAILSSKPATVETASTWICDGGRPLQRALGQQANIASCGSMKDTMAAVVAAAAAGSDTAAIDGTAWPAMVPRVWAILTHEGAWWDCFLNYTMMALTGCAFWERYRRLPHVVSTKKVGQELRQRLEQETGQRSEQETGQGSKPGTCQSAEQPIGRGVVQADMQGNKMGAERPATTLPATRRRWLQGCVAFAIICTPSFQPPPTSFITIV